MNRCQIITENPHYAGGSDSELACELTDGHEGDHTATVDYDVVDWDNDGEVWVNGKQA